MTLFNQVAVLTDADRMKSPINPLSHFLIQSMRLKNMLLLVRLLESLLYHPTIVLQTVKDVVEGLVKPA
jgi:hypothetical protein